MSQHVAVLMGGWSAEREVSLRSGAACAKALENEGFAVTCIDVTRDIAETLDRLKPDVAFNALHGRFGEDGTIQGILEILRGDVGAKALRCRQGLAIAGEDVTDLALGNGHQIGRMQPVLERQEKLEAAAQDIRLVTGLAAQGDQAGHDRAFKTPEFFDDGDAVVGNVTNDAGNAVEQQQGGEADDRQTRYHAQATIWSTRDRVMFMMFP